ncbi:hypothetical protein F4778DRAFT_31173 [Xylariomycetidae sp. FL2044]|nr:hypothetical protein F4778DRAFT_31173 [Xylariomycetidae sp. FL2044]
MPSILTLPLSCHVLSFPAKDRCAPMLNQSINQSISSGSIERAGGQYRWKWFCVFPNSSCLLPFFTKIEIPISSVSHQLCPSLAAPEGLLFFFLFLFFFRWLIISFFLVSPPLLEEQCKYSTYLAYVCLPVCLSLSVCLGFFFFPSLT